MQVWRKSGNGAPVRHVCFDCQSSADARGWYDWSTKTVETVPGDYQCGQCGLTFTVDAPAKATRKANLFLRQAVREWCAAHDMAAPFEGHYAKVDTARAARIAVAYEALPVTEYRARVAYDALARETREQYLYALSLGYVFDHTQKDPYPNSDAMAADVRVGRLQVFKDDGSHPFLAAPSFIRDLTYNDLFRAVHDLFGHAAEGFQFGPRGEENAWLHHSMMYSDTAQRALTTETRGQNSWVNFGPHAALPPTERPYAVQKAALLPREYSDWRIVLASENVTA